MFLVDLFGWWYGRGWSWALRLLLVERNLKILRFFSVGDLLKTLFAPFRQDVVSLRGSSFGIKLQAFGMNIIARFFGFGVRSVLIFLGILITLINTLISSIMLVGWPLLPLSPIIAVILFVLGVGSA